MPSQKNNLLDYGIEAGLRDGFLEETIPGLSQIPLMPIATKGVRAIRIYLNTAGLPFTFDIFSQTEKNQTTGYLFSEAFGAGNTNASYLIEFPGEKIQVFCRNTGANARLVRVAWSLYPFYPLK